MNEKEMAYAAFIEAVAPTIKVIAAWVAVAIVAIFVLVGAPYLAGAWIAWAWNPAEWATWIRAAVIVVPLLIAGAKS